MSMGCCCSKNDEKDKKAGSKGQDGGTLTQQSTTTKRKRTKKGGEAVRFVVLWDYNAASKAELTLTKGDILEEEMEERDAGPEWAFVSRVSGTRRGTGYAPRAWIAQQGTLEPEPWFFGDINRRDADRILGGLPDGTFLVRSRTGRDAENLALSIAQNNGAKHYKIKTSASDSSDGSKKKKLHYFLGVKKFASVQDMILWFTKSADGACCLLTSPPPKHEPDRIELPADVQKNWQEIPRNQITIEKEIGKGNFGVVRKGAWKATPAITLDVAIKELKPGAAASRKVFLQEAVAMKNLVHERLVKLHGIVSAEEPFWIITEFVKDGSLKNYLRKRDKEQRWLDEAKLVNISLQIADGMRYLEAKNVVHRDLAARNVLVEEKPGETVKDVAISVKIADFGMAKMSQKGRGIREKSAMELAVKWTAPEALTELRFYTSSDVWSYGIVLHEIFTHGGDPFKGMSPRQVKDFVVKERGFQERAENVPDKIYDVMTMCFNHDHNSRPSFQDLYDMLEKYFSKDSDPYERYRQ